LIELEGHRRISSFRGLDADYVATLLRFGLFIDEEKGLPGFQFHAQFQQSTVRIHHFGVRILAQVFSIPCSDLHDYGNSQHYSLAAPSVCWICVRHFGQDQPWPHYTAADEWGLWTNGRIVAISLLAEPDL
jgi:hypothetical protein